MREKAPWLVLLTVLLRPVPSPAATQPQPDKEMLRMMELLKNWDLIDNMDMMKDMQQIAPETERAPQPGTRENTPPRKKESSK